MNLQKIYGFQKSILWEYADIAHLYSKGVGKFLNRDKTFEGWSSRRGTPDIACELT